MGDGRLVERVWRHVNVSVEGTSHRKVQLPCQDANRCDELQSPDGKPILVAVVSDGAGSAVAAAEGAALACDTLLSVARQMIMAERLNPPFSTSLVGSWLSTFQEAVRAAADQRALTTRDFACTVLAAIVTERGAMFLQVGDGAIVLRDDSSDEFGWVFWPATGEYANTTFFATDPLVERHLQLAVTRRTIRDVALFSDGLQRLVLDYAARQTHSPFFEKMFRSLRDMSPFNLDVASRSLISYLDSPLVNERTDDDKTLVLASRMNGLESC